MILVNIEIHRLRDENIARDDFYYRAHHLRMSYNSFVIYLFFFFFLQKIFIFTSFAVMQQRQQFY